MSRKPRISRPRALTISRQEVVRDLDHKLSAEDAQVLEYERPRTRGECGTQRPCPFVACRHNTYLDVTYAGGIKLNFPDIGPEDMHDSCSLDVADRGPHQLEDVGRILNLTRERTRQLEGIGLRSLRSRCRREP